MVMLDTAGVHVPLVTVHVSIVVPGVLMVTALVGDAAFAKVALPVVTVHAPVPCEGVLAASVAVVPQPMF